MSQYLPIVVMFALAFLFAALSFFVSQLLTPRHPNSAKVAPYECGIVPSREPPERFSVQFYLVAMIFIMFDIEIIFLFPWAVVARELALFGLVAVLIFVALFFLSFLYEIAEGGLDWGPLKRVGRAPSGPFRAPPTGVRVVGLEGRPMVVEPAAGEPEPAEQEPAEQEEVSA